MADASPIPQGGEDGFLSLREALPEQFDRAAIEAVLAEWFKTLADLPAGLRMAVEMVRTARRFATFSLFLLFTIFRVW